jgi:N-hydroxyarylamine O-acetyltransferase
MRLHDYLDATGLEAPAAPTADALGRLHAAHRERFLFENLSIQEGGAISVELPDIERKFLDEGRGGYCFEHNTLFAAVLRECGFGCDALLGRVRRGPPERWARTHMVLAVRIPEVEEAERGASAERIWLADVGFGATGLVHPIPLRDAAVLHDRGLTYSLRRERRLWVLSMRDASGQPMDLYEFAEDPQTAGDVAVANHFTSTHPESMFRRSLTIQRVTGNRRIVLRTGVISEYANGVLHERPIDRAELAGQARDLFGVELPPAPLVCDSYAMPTVEPSIT